MGSAVSAAAAMAVAMSIAVAVSASAGCSPAGANAPTAAPPAAPTHASPAAPAIQLSSRLRGDDVTLTWQGNKADVIVEFATEPDGRYTVLDFAPRLRTSFHHPDLMPATTFYYRVRPVQGLSSAPATPVPAASETGEDWLVPRTVPDDRATPKAGGAPTNLLAESVGPDAVRLTWTDNSTDEDGFLVEHEVDGAYVVVFVVDPDVNHVGLVGEPPSSFRVRAYHYGAPSNVVHEEIPG